MPNSRMNVVHELCGKVHTLLSEGDTTANEAFDVLCNVIANGAVTMGVESETLHKNIDSAITFYENEQLLRMLRLDSLN